MHNSNMFVSCWIHFLSGKPLTVCVYTHCTHTSHIHLLSEVFFFSFFLNSLSHMTFNDFAERLRRRRCTGWVKKSSPGAGSPSVSATKAAQTLSTKRSSKARRRRLGVYPKALTEAYTSVLSAQLSRPSVETHNACSIPRSIPRGVIKANQSVWVFYASVSLATRAPGFSFSHSRWLFFFFFCNLTNSFLCFYTSICALSHPPLLGPASPSCCHTVVSFPIILSSRFAAWPHHTKFTVSVLVTTKRSWQQHK